ncbi:hypothetical protein [Silanimonas lenta]|uniref:hypothetical protein n=2 Tax=Silanimonas lenta TaxID=265429 RepID=UPI000425EA0F|nr:hypothetical protein [Silanimonas lenta]
MDIRWAGFIAPFRWLLAAIDVGRHQPAVVLGAIATTVFVGFLPSLPQSLVGLFGGQPGMALGLLTQALAFVVALLVSPVLRAGVFRIMDRAERGQPVAQPMLLEGFRDGSFRPLVLLTAMGFGLYALLFVAMVLVAAAVTDAGSLEALRVWAEQLMALQAQAEAGKPIPPEQFPAPPEGLASLVAVLFAFAPLWGFVMLGTLWGLIGVALRGHAPVAALLQGLRAVFLNALPLLALVTVLFLPAMLLFFLLGLLFGGLMALFMLLGPVLGQLLALALMLAIAVVLTAIFYGFVLAGWRATCDGGELPPADAEEGRFVA